ncbi:hypothetical protein C4F51_09875 [Cellvibrio sp. KB43]|uniref:Uncharacterized protein n=1 Tax=Cellvibrio polysaccharolyticus TaxID=2082724 RepID=A0A928V6E8_9GAMM|nr:hypothetical protein [Cellvibrio polysaccharolyticus]
MAFIYLEILFYPRLSVIQFSYTYRTFALVILGLLIYLLQGAFSYVLLQYYLRSPPEWLASTGTYLSLLPLVIQKQSQGK